MQYLWGGLSILGLLSIGFLCCEHKRHIRWRSIITALLLQILFGLIALKWEAGRQALHTVADAVSSVINYANQGVKFVFGSAIPPAGQGFVFAFQVLTIIIFFSALIAVLYHLRIMQWVTIIIGGFLSRIIGTSKAESLSATANIFVGLVEAPLTIKPYLNHLTRSEIFAVMVGGMASVSGAVLAGYALLGVPLSYLIAASFMSAPAGLLMSKLLLPETEQPAKIEHMQGARDEGQASNVIDAAARGATDGLQIALAVGASLIAFIGLIGLINGLLGAVGNRFGYASWSLETIFGWLFAPVAFLIGVPWAEAPTIGSLIGQKIAVNEFIAFSQLPVIKEHISERSLVIVSFALCGFANLSSIAIQVSGLAAMAPKQRRHIARLGLRSLLGGTIANLLSASIVGMLY